MSENTLPSKEEMAKMSHSDLVQLRDKATSKEDQNAIAPYEHRAFTREYVAENPVTGTIGMIGAIPAYQVAKVAGLTKSRSGASVDQAVEATKGVGEGIANAAKDLTPPWEINYNPMVEKVTKAAKTAVETISNTVGALLPWNQDFSAKRPVEAPTPIEAQPKRFDFNQVFNRLVGTESQGQHTDAKGNLTTSPVGAQGITQVMPKTGATPGYGVTPIQNNTKEEYLRFGKDYLRAMLKEFDGDYEKAVAAYNAGAGSVKKAITKGGDNWKDYLPKKSETIPYLKRILG